MALFKPYKILSSGLNTLPKREGQFIIVNDTAEIYVDINASTRVCLLENKTVTIDSNSTDAQYPSAKAVYDLFNSITNGNEVSY